MVVILLELQMADILLELQMVDTAGIADVVNLIAGIAIGCYYWFCCGAPLAVPKKGR